MIELRPMKSLDSHMQAFDWLSVKQEVSPYLTRNITRINYVIHFAQRKLYIRFIQSQTELSWGC